MLLKLHRGSFLEDTLPITLASSSPALTLSRPTAPHLLHPRDLSASRSLPLILAKPPCGAYYSQEPYFQDHVLLLNSTHHDACVGEVGTHLVPIACLCCQDPKGCSVCGLVAEVRPPSNDQIRGEINQNVGENRKHALIKEICKNHISFSKKRQV